jgi:hypothetical protein
MCGSYEYYGILPETHNREKWRGEREGGGERGGEEEKEKERKQEGRREEEKNERGKGSSADLECLRVSYSLQK